MKDKNYIPRFREYLKNHATTSEKFEIIPQYVYEKFSDARGANIAAHDRKLRAWALQKSQELNLTTEQFKASATWVFDFTSGTFSRPMAYPR